MVCVAWTLPSKAAAHLKGRTTRNCGGWLRSCLGTPMNSATCEGILARTPPYLRVAPHHARSAAREECPQRQARLPFAVP